MCIPFAVPLCTPDDVLLFLWLTSAVPPFLYSFLPVVLLPC